MIFEKTMFENQKQIMNNNTINNNNDNNNDDDNDNDNKQKPNKLCTAFIYF